VSEKNIVPSVSGGWLSCIFKGLKFIVVSYVLSVVLIAILSAVIVFTDISESCSTPCVKVITFIGVFASAYLLSRTSQSRGWLGGALTGGANIGLLIIIGTALNANNPFTLSNLVSVLIGCFVGSVGGICGINSKKN